MRRLGNACARYDTLARLWKKFCRNDGEIHREIFLIIFVFNFVTEGSYEKLYTPTPGVETVRERGLIRNFTLFMRKSYGNFTLFNLTICQK